MSFALMWDQKTPEGTLMMHFSYAEYREKTSHHRYLVPPNEKDSLLEPLSGLFHKTFLNFVRL